MIKIEDFRTGFTLALSNLTVSVPYLNQTLMSKFSKTIRHSKQIQNKIS